MDEKKHRMKKNMDEKKTSDKKLTNRYNSRRGSRRWAIIFFVVNIFWINIRKKKSQNEPDVF